MFFTKQGLALAIRPLFDEEEENNEQSEIHEKSDFPVKSKDFI